MVVSTTPTNNCVSCRLEKHQLYSCAEFRSLSHAEKMNLLRSKNYSLNCLPPGHFVKKCQSLNHCKLCQCLHHTLLHQEIKDAAAKLITSDATTPTSESTTMHVSVSSNILFMTCQVMVDTPQGMIKTRALLDAFIVPQITGNHPMCAVSFNQNWKHLEGFTLRIQAWKDRYLAWC